MQETPPQARGRQSGDDWRGSGAGKHPRRRGEDSPLIAVRNSGYETPPQARGRLEGLLRDYGHIEKHPRRRGED